MIKKRVLLVLFTFFSTQNLSAGFIPVVASFDGVGGVFGAAYSENFGANSIIVGGATGDLNAAGGKYTRFFGDNFEISLGALAFTDVGLITTYERDLINDEDDLYILNMEGSAYNISTKWWLFSDYVTLGLSGTQSTVKLKSYDDDELEEIDLAGANLFDIKTTEAKFTLNLNFFDDQRTPTQGLGVSTSLSHVSGRLGQSDQKILNYGLVGITPLLTHFSILGSMSFSDAMVEVNSDYDTEAEIRDELDADCASLTNASERAKCEKLENSLVDYILQNNTRGTAEPIGGSSGLRSFRQFRFKAAHTALYILEFQTNLSSLLNILNYEDSRLSFVLFHDIGYANDDKLLLFDKSKNSNGIGLRYTQNRNSVNLQIASGSDDSSSWSLGFGKAF